MVADGAKNGASVTPAAKAANIEKAPRGSHIPKRSWDHMYARTYVRYMGSGTKIFGVIFRHHMLCMYVISYGTVIITHYGMK
jgi:hypothetical protein